MTNLAPFEKFKVTILLAFQDAASGETKFPVLCRECKRGTGDTWWEFPGGKREKVAGENRIQTPIEATQAELGEELAIHLTTDYLNNNSVLLADPLVVPHNPHIVSKFLFVRGPSDQVPVNNEPGEHKEMRLVTAREALELVDPSRRTDEVSEFLKRIAAKEPA